MKKTLRSVLALTFAIAMLLTVVAACADGDGGSGSGAARIGISLPTMSLQRWVQDGDNMREQFEAAGFEVDLQYGGENDVPTQIAQLENMIAQGVDALVICAIDGFALTEVLAQAKAAGIPVIAYDRLIMNTDAVTYYATFDNFQVGVLQGTFLENALNLSAGGGPYNIEFFTGDPGDNNIHFFFGGAMSVLQKYLDNGTLHCPSGETDIMQVATVAWDPANAQARMENLIATYGYAPSGGTPLHAVMCSNDSTAQGVTTALQGGGFTADNFPLITGQDCDIVSVRNMIAGYQAMSVFKDTRTLAANVVAMVKAIVAGTEVPINDRETYDNGTGVIPTNLSVPVFADINNWEALLIDSGYYTRDQIG
ncbi:MAG: sugar-binding protein [Oscillospiraceae bacterium]|nr:sugar-binding protein [Oscillospiraceae bacterium]